MNQLGEGSFSPGPRGSIEFLRKGAHGNRDGNVHWRKEGEFVLPVQTSRRYRRIRQPVERDVIEDVVSRKSLVLTVKDAFNERVTACVMVQYPSSKADWR